ncbi:MAG: histidine phosphatase family protein [Vicinamibacterales bacterium]
MIQSAERFVLFVRHADRPPIPKDDPYADVGLTESGQAAIGSLAAELKGRVCWTAASPYKRCQITADGLGAEPELDTRLGRPGPWIVSREEVFPEFEARGSMGVVRALVDGVKLPGMRSAEEAVPRLLAAGLERAARGSGVCVSHYSILMPAMAWLFGPAAAAEQLPPLDGFALELRDSGLVACWRGQERAVPERVSTHETTD